MILLAQQLRSSLMFFYAFGGLIGLKLDEPVLIFLAGVGPSCQLGVLSTFKI